MQKQNEFDVQRYVNIFKKYKWHGLIPACIVTVVLVVASSFLPKVYESTCIVEVDQGTIENPLKTRPESAPALSDNVTTFSENALRWGILSRVVDEVGADVILENSDVYNLRKLKRDLGLGGKPAPAKADDYGKKEMVARLLKKQIQFQQRPPRFLILKYRGVHSDVNAKILNTLVSKLIEEKTASELNRAGKSYEFIRTEMENYRRKLEEAEARLKEFKEQHITELPANMNTNLAQLTKDKSEILTLELEMKELKTKAEYIDEQSTKEKSLIVSEVKKEANPLLMVLNERIVDMEIELTRLRTNYTELHPRVAELRGQLEDLKRQREALEDSTVNSETSMLNPVYQQLNKEKQDTLMRMEVLRDRISNLKKRIDDSEEKVQSMPEQEQQLLTLTRNYDVTANIYNMFVQKLEEVRLQEKLASEEKNKQSFRVFEYARATLAPVAPNRFRILLIVLMIGSGTWFGVMLSFDYFDDSFRSVEEVKEFLGKPLLGAIPCLTNGSDNGTVSVRKRFLKRPGIS